MADPVKYTPSYSFTGNPSFFPATPLNVEFLNVSQSVAQTVEALKDVRRSDGRLKNKIVTFDSLDAALRLRLDTPEFQAALAKLTLIAASDGSTALPLTYELIQGKPSSLAGYGIADAYTSAQTDAAIAAAIDAIPDPVPGGGGVLFATEAQAVAGTSTGVVMSPLRTRQAITGLRAKPDGIAGLDADGKVPKAQLPAISTSAPSVKDYGAKGDNTTDDTAAFEAALAANNVLYVPAGKYVLTRALTKTGNLVLFGDGPAVTQLVWAGSASRGIQSNICNSGDPREACQVRGIALIAREYVAGSVALSIKRAQTGSDVCMSVLIRDVLIGRDTNAFQQGWTRGIDLDACTNVFIDTFTFAGKVTGGPSGGEPQYDSTHGIRFHNDSGTSPHPTVLNLSNSVIFHSNNGVTANDMEGLLVNGCQIVGCNYGVVGQGTSSYGDPHFSVIGSHINCSVRSILVKRMSQIVISGNVLYSQLHTSAAAAQIEVSGGSNLVKVIGNDFENLSSTYAADSVYLDDVLYGVVSGNTFRRTSPNGGAAAGAAVTLGANTRGVVVANDNVYTPEVATKVRDLGTGNMQPGYGGRFTKSGSQTLTAGSLRIINFETTDSTIGNLGDNLADGAFVVPSAGLWAISASIQCSSVAIDDTVTINIQKNAVSGSPIKSFSPFFRENAPVVAAIEHTTWLEKDDVIRIGINSSQARSALATVNTFLEVRRAA
ncbi:glycosyl hydrolase family 28-related protein [Aureimonas psammosilenae]|uniref:glycosyl hydrolase family 28-related protein n=1 Tax=Aureimonas psammosilenae TaxID=2495496 RepID=UPI001260D6EC|nr:glycosyl hydrolase family 28-related protein [Aureimonas psammosilenae]